MTLEKDNQVREQMIREGYEPKQIDDISKNIGIGYGQMRELGEIAKNWFYGEA